MTSYVILGTIYQPILFLNTKMTLCIYSLHNVTVKLQPVDIKSPLVYYTLLFIFPLHIIVYIYTLFLKQFVLFSDYLFCLYPTFKRTNLIKKRTNISSLSNLGSQSAIYSILYQLVYLLKHLQHTLHPFR